MRRRATLAGVLPIAAVVTVAIVLVLGPTSVKSPLLIPTAHAGPGAGQIEFFGVLFEGDSFVWCLDKSGSMNWGGRIDVLKQEMAEVLTAISQRVEFSIVAFSADTIYWNLTPQAATIPGKVSAIAWVQGIDAGGMTLMAPALTRIIEISNLSRRKSKQIILLSDGEPSDGKETVLGAARRTNRERTPINTILISRSGSAARFFRQLATEHGGTFTKIQ